MDRLISENKVLEVIDSLKVNFTCYDSVTLDEVYSHVKAIPSAEPKTGHWFVDERPESDREIICSNCEQSIFKYHKMDFDYRPKFCSNCGAKMIESQEGEKV